MRCKKNQPSNLGSSETTREAPQSIQLIIYEQLGKPDHIQNIDKYFLHWFIGFSEGDGSFEQSKQAFFINQKDPKLLFRIKKKLGFGSVYQTTNPSIWQYSVTGQTNCLRLYYLFNGNLVLPKTIERFQNWAIRLAPKTSIQKIGLIVRLDNGWLSGFIEAKGYFSARVRKKNQMKLRYQFQKKFSITQKGEQDVLHQILFLLKSNTKIYTFEQNNKRYRRIDINSFSSHNLLLNYLSKFPIFGIKNVSICIWRKMHGRQDRNEHLTEIGLDKIRNLCHLLKKNNQRCN